MGCKPSLTPFRTDGEGPHGKEPMTMGGHSRPKFCLFHSALCIFFPCLLLLVLTSVPIPFF